MPILDAALAFTLTMLVVAHGVTLIVGLLHRLSGTRSDLLDRMLRDFFDGELRPVVDLELKRRSGRLHVRTAAPLSELARDLRARDLFGDVRARKLEGVSTEELIERLERTDFGGELLRLLGDDARPVFAALGRSWEAIGERFTDSFRRHSRRWATGVAFALALVINIDSVTMLDAYLRSPHLRDEAIDRMEAIVSAYEESAAEDADSQEDATPEELEAAFEETREHLELLARSGLPMGWSYPPHACAFGQPHPSADESDTTPAACAGWPWSGLDWIAWLFGVALTGLLAGLGAPFWYDTVGVVSRLVTRSRTPASG